MHDDDPDAASTERTLLEAIARRHAVTAVYNGTELELAPHSLFARHGDLFLAALNLRRIWRSDEELRLGVFKLAGLSHVVMTGATFDEVPADPTGVMRPDDQLVFSI